MKNIVSASLVLACFVAVQPCFASADSDVASELSATPVLSTLAVSECTCELSTNAVSGAGRKLVKLVDATGKAIGELTMDTLDVEGKLLDESDAPRVTIDKKEIPLVVRGDYVEMSQPIQQK
jgi:hypothetical protein